MLVHTEDKRFIAACDECGIECGHIGEPAIYFMYDINKMFCTKHRNEYHGTRSKGALHKTRQQLKEYYVMD